jgi:DNA repair photolyase
MEPGQSGRGWRGRGVAANPGNRFEHAWFEPDPEWEADEERSAPRTQFLADLSQSIITRNDSPDVGFDRSINPYRGCEHGCVYCYARPTHEYLGFSSGLDFETRIMVKERAPALLRAALEKPTWEPGVLVMSGVTDPYQPVERKLEITRGCLRVLAEFRNPVAIVTKNHLVTRDIDFLSELASVRAAAVFVSLTTLDPALARVMEPRTASPEHRLDAIRRLAAAGIPAGVMTAPIVPGLTDHEIPKLLEAAAEAGASFAGYTVLRLPHAVKDLFGNWLETHFPGKKDRVLSRVREVRGGKLNDARFGSRMRGEGVFAEQIRSLFRVARRRAGLDRAVPELSITAFRRPGGVQMELFTTKSTKDTKGRACEK